MNTIKYPFKHLVAHHKCITPFEYIVEILPKCTSQGPWLAGGALLRTYTGKPLDSDVDVFFQSKEQLEQYIAELSLKSYKGAAEDRKSNHYTVKDMIVSEWHTTITVNYMDRDWKIQCVSFVYFKDIGELFDSFDFDVCMLAYDGTEVFVSPTTFDAIANKKTKLVKINYPSVTLKRLVKYMRHGYDVDDSDVMALAKSFKGVKEPRGILDEHFGIDGTGKKTADGSDYRGMSNSNQPRTVLTGSYHTPQSSNANLPQQNNDPKDALFGALVALSMASTGGTTIQPPDPLFDQITRLLQGCLTKNNSSAKF
jgi:hypothetical protein